MNVATEQEAYLEAVRRALADLDPAVRDELLEDLPEHLAEVAAEGEGTLTERLGPPEAYAAELRTAAGVGVAAAPVARGLDDRIAAAVRRARGVLGAADRKTGPLLGYGRGQRVPAYAGAGLVGAARLPGRDGDHLVDRDGNDAGLLPRLGGSTLAAALLLAVCLLASIWLGRREPTLSATPRAGLAIGGVLLVLFGMVVFDKADHYGAGWDQTQSVSVNPYEYIQDVYVYDENGNPLTNVTPVRPGRQPDPARRPVPVPGGVLPGAGRALPRTRTARTSGRTDRAAPRPAVRPTDRSGAELPTPEATTRPSRPAHRPRPPPRRPRQSDADQLISISTVIESDVACTEREKRGVCHVAVVFRSPVRHGKVLAPLPADRDNGSRRCLTRQEDGPWVRRSTYPSLGGTTRRLPRRAGRCHRRRARRDRAARVVGPDPAHQRRSPTASPRPASSPSRPTSTRAGRPPTGRPRRQLAADLSRDRVAQDLTGAAEFLAARPEVNGEIGAVGFSTGGSLALWAPTLSERVTAGVGFYPSLPWEFLGPQWSGYAAKHAVIHCSEEDGTSEAAAVRSVADAITAAGGTVKLYDYPGSRHSFFNDDRPESYDRVDAVTAWARTIETVRRLAPTVV